MASILDSLNEAQHTAVTSPSNVLQILAPPGSGKTKTLTSRVAHLLQHDHYKPWNVICLTFTIKSSREMKERIAKLLGNGIERRLILGTFHSVCRRYLVTYGHLIGLRKDFGIADSSDTIGIIKRIIKRLGVAVDPRRAQSRISGSKSRGVSSTGLAQEKSKQKNVEQQEFAMVFEAYEDQLTTSNLLDYDDLLLRCVDLLRQHPTCVSNVEAVLIDEFQDTNVVQFDLMRLFAAKNKRVTTVGDPDQSIYGWRSAEIKNLKRMQELYPDTLVIHLEDNYRSSGAILLAAHEVIEQDESRPSKPLLPTHCPGTVPVLRRLPSAEIEASWIVSEIQRASALMGAILEFSDFAILLRSASLSRHIESAMGKAGIPHRMVGGQRFFDRIEIKILLDYLRIISQPHNNDALSRVINVPSRGVGATTAKGLLEDAEIRGRSLWTHLRDSIQSSKHSKTKVSKTAENGLGSFIGIVSNARRKVLDSATPHSPEELLKYIIKKLDFKAYLEKNHPDDHEARWANVEELLAQASEFAIITRDASVKEEEVLPQIDGLERATGNAADEALSRFLANVALATELQREDEDIEDKPHSQVTISTIHAAKGLEWPVVFVPSTYEGCIPHSRAEDTDEERRLLYVAMTRAQALLYLSCPTKSSQREATTLSPFLSTKQVGQYLVNKGPVIGASTVNDICRILRRDCPTQAQIAEASQMILSSNDDLWPLDGEEDVKAIAARQSKWDNYDSHRPNAKRRRLAQHDSNHLDAMSAGGSAIFGTYGAPTTMQNSSTFSCNGFVSATSQLRQDAQPIETQPALKATLTSKLKSKSVPAVDGVVQGSLMSFWRKDGGIDTRQSQAGIAKSSQKQKTLELTTGHLNASRSVDHDSALLVNTTRKQASIAESTAAERKPLVTIPQALSTHRLPAVRGSSRPLLEAAEGDFTKKPYVFLSSSPPPSNMLLEEAEKPSEEPPLGKIMQGLDNSYEPPDIRPAKTLHTISVTQIQASMTETRKTLGVRRSMQGWTGRPRQGFSVPKMTGATSRNHQR